ncbi:MAG: CinA family protein [Rhodospirillales bacterium]|nr:CinA family protein [Rhodospirillales bacterium]
MFPPPVLQLVEAVLAGCRARGLRLATAESCTGGLIVSALTAVSGSSDVVERGFITYTNESKTAMLGVPAPLIAVHGAVSEPVAEAMAEGALVHSPADIAVAVTGIAGPTGGTPEKPVGLVHLAAARRGGAMLHERHVFGGDRTAIREQTVEAALRMIEHLAKEPS